MSLCTRTPTDAVKHRRGPAHTLFLRSARVHSTSRTVHLARTCGLTTRAIERVPRRHDDLTHRVGRVAADDRFDGLRPGSLAIRLSRTRYARLLRRG